MINFYLQLFLAFFLWLMFLNQDIPKKEIDVEWHQSHLGGGGFITGLLQDPFEPNTFYARCDVAGVFKSTDGARTWKPVNRGLTLVHHHNVESFAVSPHRPGVLLRGSGEARDHQLTGNIHKSIDGGETWYQVSDEVEFFGNGPNRMYGEKITFDPFNKQRVAAAGFSNGVFISNDEGETWEYAGLAGEPISTLVYHPHRPDVLLAATLDEIRMQDYLEETNQRPKEGRLFVSYDHGQNWTQLIEGDLQFSQLAFSAQDHDIIYAACLEDGIFKSTDGGHHFGKIGSDLPGGASYDAITVDPHSPEVLYTAPSRRGRHTWIPLVPVYRSTNGGKSWQQLHNYQEADFINYPDYIKTREWVGWAISKILVDQQDPDKLIMSNWYGVSISEDRGKTWNGNYYQGTETICAEDVEVCDGKVYFTMADHQPVYSVNGGKNYHQFVKLKEKFRSSTALATSNEDENFTLYGVTERGSIHSAIIRSKDNGQSYQVMKQLNPGLYVQAIKEDPFYSGRFYAYIDGELTAGAGIYRSNDWGSNWQKLPSPFPDYILTLPHHKSWIESELLPIVYYQVKNVTGTNQLMAVDPQREGYIMVGEWTEGLFLSDNGGQTWKDVTANLPFNSRVTALNCVAFSPHQQGVLYAGFIKEGLWKSEDDGRHWLKIFPATGEIFNATTISVGQFDPEEIIVACEPLYYSPSPSSVYLSMDAGESWQKIYHNEFGALRWKSIAVDQKSGRIYGVTAGNGAFYAER